MKVFIIVFAGILATEALTEDQQQKIEQFSKDCLSISKLDEEVLKEAEKGNYTDDPKLKKHALCFSQKIKMQNENGELQTEEIKARLSTQIEDKQEVEKLVKMCLVQKDNAENTAFEGLKCFHKNLPKGVSLI